MGSVSKLHLEPEDTVSYFPGLTGGRFLVINCPRCDWLLQSLVTFELILAGLLSDEHIASTLNH